MKRLVKIAISMLLMAIGVAWIAALAFPLAVKLGLTESAASRLPNFGLFAGAALGLAMCMVESIKRFLISISLIFVTAFVFWFFAMELESVLLAFGASERVLKWLQPAAFCFGALLTSFALSVELYEKLGVSIRRRRQ